MRTTWAVVGLMVALAAPAAAQGGGNRGMMNAPKSGQGVLKGITLTADQQKKVDSIWNANAPKREEQMAKMRAMRESGERPDSATRAAMRAARQAQLKVYRDILTPDQQQVFDRNIAEGMQRMGRPSGGASPQ